MSHLSEKLSPLELRAGVSLALIYAFRMFGIFLILPVFALFAEDLPGSTPLLAGLALGIYGLTQAILQIPFGMLSDRIGRKPVIMFGLLIFAAGSLVAASAETMTGIIAGRALQGSGAIAAALMALAADLSREEHRIKMMAMIGSSIGAAFALSMVLAPIISQWIGVSGIFAATAGLAILGIIILFVLVPSPVHSQFHSDAELQPANLMGVLKTPDLLRLDAGIFILHFVLMCVFLVMPLELRDIGLPQAQHWKMYLPVFVLSVLIMVPFIIIAEKKRQIKPVFVGAIIALCLAVAGFSQDLSMVAVSISLVLFFTAFNLLEAMLPSLVSKTAHAGTKGTAMGVYSSSQFLGAFAGGLLGGLAHSQWGIQGVYMTALVALVMWVVIALSMKKPRHYSTYMLHLGDVPQQSVEGLSQSLLAVKGVIEVAILPEEGAAHLKVEKHILDEEKLLSFAVSD